MNYTCPKCGNKIELTTEELIDRQYMVRCPQCMSDLQIVGDYAYIPHDSLELDTSVQPSESFSCPKCGHQVNSNSHFCPNCGNSYDSQPDVPAVVNGQMPTPPPPPQIEGKDPLYNEALAFLAECSSITPMTLRDRFSITDERAAELIRQLEEGGAIGPYNNGGPRQILIPHRGLMNHRSGREMTPDGSPGTQENKQAPARGGFGCITWFVILMFIIMMARSCAG